MPFNQEREQKRASFAFRLTKWLDEDGEKLSEDEEGIVAHQDAVEFYEALYGPLSEGGRNQYYNLYRNIRKGMEDTRQNEERSQAIMQRYRDKREQEAAELAQLREVRAAASRLRKAEDELIRSETQESLLKERIIPQSESHFDILTSDTIRLRSMLPRYQAGGRRHTMLLEEAEKNERMLEGVSADLVGQRDELEECRQTIRECQAAIAQCQAILSGEENDGSESDAVAFRVPSNADIVVDGRDMEFVLKSNGWYHPAGSRADFFITSIGYSRDRGSAFAVSPDGRAKAWPDSGPASVSINGVELQFVDMGSYLQCQLDVGQVQELVGAVYQAA